VKALIQIAMELEVEDKEQVRVLAREMRKSILLNALSQMERAGINAADVEDQMTVYAPTITYPLPLAVPD
jgi:hypothetical protein